MMRKNGVLFLILFVVGLNGLSQSDPKIDSLRAVISQTKNDTVRVKLLMDLVSVSKFTMPDSALKWITEANLLAVESDFEAGIGATLNAKGSLYFFLQQYDEALDYYFKAAAEFEKQNRRQGLAAAMLNIGLTYYNQREIVKALDADFKSLALYEEVKNDKGKAIVLGNIGIIYQFNKEIDKALEFGNKAMAIDKALGNTASVGRHLTNIGVLYYDQGNIFEKQNDTKSRDKCYKLALETYFQALEIAEKNDEKGLMATNFGNLASLYFNKGDTLKSDEYNKKAYAIYEEFDYKEGMSRILGNMGWQYLNSKRYKEAEDYTLKALNIASSIQNLEMLMKWNENLSALYENTGKPELALQHYKLGISFRDSLYSIENTKKLTETKMRFEFQKKEASAKEEASRQNLIKNAFIAAFVMMMIIAAIVFRGYRNKRKSNLIISAQKEEMERQKILVEIKNKEITDSITYAKRIQLSLLTNEKYIQRNLQNLNKK